MEAPCHPPSYSAQFIAVLDLPPGGDFLMYCGLQSGLVSVNVPLPPVNVKQSIGSGSLVGFALRLFFKVNRW
jgi:hypothetical protein